jgi:hypothetical protein
VLGNRTKGISTVLIRPERSWPGFQAGRLVAQGRPHWGPEAKLKSRPAALSLYSTCCEGSKLNPLGARLKPRRAACWPQGGHWGVQAKAQSSCALMLSRSMRHKLAHNRTVQWASPKADTNSHNEDYIVTGPWPQVSPHPPSNPTSGKGQT